jgi:hypothetical protein
MIKPKKFSPEVLATFRRMQTLETECTCAPIEWEGKYWERQRCRACEQWWQAHSRLHEQLSLRPTQWPAVEDPQAGIDPANPAAYPPPDLEAQARYLALANAALALP